MNSKAPGTDESSRASEFSHIRVVRKPDPIPTGSESPQPTFRNPSLTFETDAPLEDDPFSSVKSETLASHPVGVTFAAKARAAELQAARARKELRSADNSIWIPHEVMTFKSKSTKKKWNPLDLSNLPESGEVSPTRASEAIELGKVREAALKEAAKTAQPGNERGDGNDAVAAGSANQQPTFAEMLKTDNRSETAHPVSWPYAAPHQNGRDQVVEVLKRNVESPAPTEAKNASKENDALSGHVLPGLSRGPGPVLANTVNLAWNQERTAKLIQEQEKQIADLTAQLRVRDVNHPPIVPASQPGTARQLPGASYGGPLDSRPDDAARAMPQRQYPAVKGTLGNTIRPTFATVRPPPGLENQVPSNRRASEEQKTFLQRQLHDVADQSSSHQASFSAHEGPATDQPVDRKELLSSSEPLPWKDRRVPIAIDTLNPYYSCLATPKTPEPIDFPPPRLDSFPSSPIKKSREEELNDWWTRDNRINLRFKQEINAFMAEADARRSMRKDADKEALRDANFSDERYDEGSGTRVPYDMEEEGAICRQLLVPVLANLKAYETDRPGHFNRFARPPSWAIDHTPQGNQSFFSQGWGVPPPRVGRDPRYRAVQHDGRSSVFEDPTGQWPREEYNRRWGW
ncbi:MAG: hypothetical protein LQ340_004359 [Diploschistes diacapsis]|nr:MAG: hypothetical protein LQ340_004359 [Diploschistes diacapsis]